MKIVIQEEVILPGLELAGLRFIERREKEEGSQGYIWVARDLNISRTVAAKLFYWSIEDDFHEDTKEDWNKEAEI